MSEIDFANVLDQEKGDLSAESTRVKGWGHRQSFQLTNLYNNLLAERNVVKVWAAIKVCSCEVDNVSLGLLPDVMPRRRRRFLARVDLAVVRN